MKFYGLTRRVVLSSLPFLLIFLGALGVSAVKYNVEADARKPEVSVPRMGLVASDGWFEGRWRRRGDWQNLSIWVSESVILGELRVTQEVTILQKATENAEF